MLRLISGPAGGAPASGPPEPGKGSAPEHRQVLRGREGSAVEGDADCLRIRVDSQPLAERPCYCRGSMRCLTCAQWQRVHRDVGQRTEARHAELVARASRIGVRLQRTANGSWLASRWSLVRELSDLEVEAWLDRVGGRP